MIATPPTPASRPPMGKLLLGVVAGSILGALVGLLIWPPFLAFIIGIPIAVRLTDVKSSRSGAAVGLAPGAVIALLLILERINEFEGGFMLIALGCTPFLGAAIGAGVGAVAARILRALSGDAGFVP